VVMDRRSNHDNESMIGGLGRVEAAG
jgi:hypothetical protein